MLVNQDYDIGDIVLIETSHNTVQTRIVTETAVTQDLRSCNPFVIACNIKSELLDEVDCK